MTLQGYGNYANVDINGRLCVTVYIPKKTTFPVNSIINNVGPSRNWTNATPTHN